MAANHRSFLFFLLLGFGVLGGLPALAVETLPGPVAAHVLRVVDGDTLAVRVRIWPGHQVETLVRLKGIDAPELKARCERERVLAHAALDFLEARTAKATIWLNDIRFGKYAGRVLARVTMASGADLSDQLLAAGLVRNYAGARRASWCNDTNAATAAP